MLPRGSADLRRLDFLKAAMELESRCPEGTEGRDRRAERIHNDVVSRRQLALREAGHGLQSPSPSRASVGRIWRQTFGGGVKGWALALRHRFRFLGFR